jgi:hypothetical protein
MLLCWQKFESFHVLSDQLAADFQHLETAVSGVLDLQSFRHCHIADKHAAGLLAVCGRRK